MAGLNASDLNRIGIGAGGRAGFNFNNAIGVEFQLVYQGMHSGYELQPDFDPDILRGSGHLKLTWRTEDKWKTNLFAVLGPGFHRESQERRISFTQYEPYRVNKFTFRSGAGLEVVLRRWLIFRIDAADYVVRTVPANSQQSEWQHHLDTSAGIGFRF